MLYHIRPRLCSEFNLVRLLSVTVQPLGLELVGDLDVVARRPYLNRMYAVACARSEVAPTDGILIESADRVDELTYVARWTVAGRIMTHKVIMMIVDQDYDAVTDSMMLWLRSGRRWKNRWPKDVPFSQPLYWEPVMDIVPGGQLRVGMEDWIDNSGFIVQREQVLQVPTVEEARVLRPERWIGSNPRMPDIACAFRKDDLPARRAMGNCMLCGKPAMGWCGCSREPVIVL
jgi:hypothetical protein